MSAGSSPDTGGDLHGFVIPITEPLIVEIDTESTAAYIRLHHGKAVRTESFASDRGFVMLDFDKDRNVLGIEVIGQQEFGIREWIKLVTMQVTESILDRTRYIAANLQAA